MVYKAEYLWLDGSTPSARLRSKTKIIANDMGGGRLWAPPPPIFNVELLRAACGVGLNAGVTRFLDELIDSPG